MTDLLPCPTDAIENLTNFQEQADMHGEFVKVSRQALDEVLAYVTRTPPATQADVLVDELARVIGMARKDTFRPGKGWLYDAFIARATLPIIQRERAAAHAAGRAEERAEVVAWLREAPWPMRNDALIDAIERGQDGSKGDE